MIYEGTTVHLAAGDIITSKKGILMGSAFAGTSYLMMEGEYLGGGKWRVIRKESRDPNPFKG